ncbi:MAG: HAMP domain-containing sensor histidine kinase [Xenococcaceae cyanobacterium MO_188.B29]|nr:HAMP domain-containing sensor histidine kinase [Xenococcaceae cyanobacterium MO_188.B29]
MRNKFDSSSLRVRLTVGMALFSAIGLGSLAIWTGMRMQHILIVTHKENIKYIAERFPQDVKIYTEMATLPVATQKAIDNLASADKLLWVKTNSGQVTALAADLEKDGIGEILLPLNNVPPIPQVRDLNGSYWLMCATPLKVDDKYLGDLFIAQDITKDQVMFLNLMRSLSIATFIMIVVMTLTIAHYINYLIRPLKRISQLTENVSADKLSEAHIHLENAPSEVRELADTFDEMLVRLSEAWEHQRELLSNVSHELRTPLTIISGYLQSTLRRGDNLTEIQKEALTTASSEADRTVQLLQDLLDLARADSGRMHFQLESVILNDLIEEVVGMTKQYSNHQINIELPHQLVQVKADANRLKQVLLNLIDNAVKYSDEEQAINIKVQQQQQQTIIQVCDRGMGIPLQQQNRIFERFYRVDEARNRSGGTGLGLSIVKTLVEGMGGSISVRSQIGEGTTFAVKLLSI